MGINTRAEPLSEGASVYTSDDVRVGDVHRLVSDPRDGGQVTHIVVEKDTVLTEDKVIPVDLVATANPDRVELETDVDLHTLMPFEAADYLEGYEYNRCAGDAEHDHPAEELLSRRRRVIYWYGSTKSQPSPLGTGNPETLSHGAVEQYIPRDTIPLLKGTRAMSCDNFEVGKVEEVITDDQGEVTDLILDKGLLFKNRKRIPAYWVQSASGDGVQLAVTDIIVERVPKYRR